MLRRAAFAAVTAVALGGALAQPAAAQINPFRSSFANGLGDDDFQRLADASTALLNRDHLQVGATEAWRNPATGVGGTISVTRNFKARGYDCHGLLYSTTPDEARAPRQTRLNWCNTPEGWKIL